jgi:hypothetical protein
MLNKNTSNIPSKALKALLKSPFNKELWWIKPIALKDLSQFPKSLKVVDEIRSTLGETLNRRKKSDQGKVDHALRLILSNLVYCTFSRMPLALTNKTSDFTRGKGSLSKLFLSKNATRDVLNALSPRYITKTKGHILKEEVNKYTPTRELSEKLLPLIYNVVEEYEDSKAHEYIEFKVESNKERDKRRKHNKKVKKEAQDNNYNKGMFAYLGMLRNKPELLHTMGTSSFGHNHPDIKRLRIINRYLSNVSYALKAPIRRIYTKDPFHGGRLYLPIQSLMQRRAPIRINTLINGKKICEVDLKANHPRIAAALAGEQLTEDPYLDIAKKAKVSREKVKYYVLRAIGSEDERISLKEEGKRILIPEEKRKIVQATKELFPSVHKVFYNKYGSSYQALEGDIMLNAMVTLVNLNIPSLPIHDCLMVQQGKEKIAKKCLEESWMKVLNVKFKPYISIKTF